jgi:glycine cleavage system H protein
MSERRNYMGSFWMANENGVVTIGVTEEALEDFDEIVTIDLSPEGEKIEADSVIGTIETSDGPLDVYSPVDGEILEINSQVMEDPSLIMEDPTEEGWLFRIETEAASDEDEDEEEEDDEDEDEEYEDDEEE